MLSSPSSHSNAHRAQLANLRAWVQSHRSEWGALRYHPWTGADVSRDSTLALRQSKLLPPTMGVITTKPCSGGVVLCGYPGVVMWEEMHDKFGQSFHCPTAVHAPELDYLVDLSTANKLGLDIGSPQVHRKGARGRYNVRIVIVGDPTAVGPLVNSPLGMVSTQGKPLLASCLFGSKTRAQLPATEVAIGGVSKQQVPADFIHIKSQGPLITDTELLVPYTKTKSRRLDSANGGTFWSRLMPYCTACQGVKEDVSPLVQCSQEKCNDSIHIACAGMEVDSTWACLSHAHPPQVLMTPPRPVNVAVAAPGARSAAMVVPSYPDWWTPPQKAAQSATLPACQLPSTALTAQPQCYPAWWTPPRQATRPPSTAPGAQSGVARSLHASLNHQILPRVPASAPGPVMGSTPRHRMSTAQPRQLAAVMRHLPAQAAVDREPMCRSNVEAPPSLELQQVECRLVNGTSGSDNETDCSSQYGDSDWYDSDSDNTADPPMIGTKSNRVACAPPRSESTQRVRVAVSTSQSGSRRFSVKAPHEATTSLAVGVVPSEVDRIRVQWRMFAEGKDANEWLRNCASMAGDQRYSRTRDDTMIEQLNKARLQLQFCCAGTQSLQHQGLQTMPDFCKSESAMLRCRLLQLRLWGYAKSKRNAYIRQQFEAQDAATRLDRVTSVRQPDKPPDRPWNFDKLRMCSQCFISCLGISDSTLRRVLSIPKLEHALVDSAPRRRNSCSKIALIRRHMWEWAASKGQSLPTAEGGAHKGHYVMNDSSLDEARATLIKYMAKGGIRIEVTRSNFARARAELRKLEDVIVSCSKSKSLATCGKCDEWKGKRKKAEEADDMDEWEVCDKALQAHRDEADEHREVFEMWKKQALRFPFKTWAMIIDGMDSLKTAMPHLSQTIKNIDLQLNVRVVGCMMFGAPLPVQAITCLDDVSVKGGAASITHIELVLDNQWLALLPSEVAPLMEERVGGRRGQVELSAAQAQKLSHDNVNAPIQHQPPRESKSDGLPGPTAFPSESTFPRSKRFPFYWPEHLHLTFDNTASDYKNKAVFNFLGILVALCVFSYITISTGIVGHTHDIVDQMFSVWARQLQITDVYTLSLLHAMFRNKYATPIYAVEAQLKAQRRAAEEEKEEAAAAAAAAANGSDAPKARTRKESNPVHSILQQLSTELGLSVVVLRQTFCIEPFPLLESDFKDFAGLHIFLIQRVLDWDRSTDPPTEREAIVLKSRHVAKPQSAEDRVMFNEQGPGGPYTSCTRLFWVDEVPWNSNIYRSPAFHMPVDQLRKQFNTQYGTKFDQQHRDEWAALLNQMEDNFNDDVSKCPSADPDSPGHTLCEKYRSDREKVGTLHRPDDGASEQTKKLYNTNRSIKDTAVAALHKHLSEVPHPHLMLPNWLRKWKERADTVIRPYFAERGIKVDLTGVSRKPAGQAEVDPEMLGRSPHPLKMPHDSHRGVIIKASTLADCVGKNKRQPQVGDVVATRGPPWYPVWIGQVDNLHSTLERQLDNWLSKRKRLYESDGASPPQHKKFHRGSTGLRGGRGGRSKAAAAAPAAAAAAAPTRKSKSGGRGGRAGSKQSTAAIAPAAAAAAADSTSTTGKRARHAVRVCYAESNPDEGESDGDQGYERKSDLDADYDASDADSDGDDHVWSDSDSEEATPAAAAAARDYEPAAYKARKLAKRVKQLSGQLCVRWYSYVAKGKKPMDDAPSIMAELKKGQDSAQQLALWHSAVSAWDSQKFCRLPAHAVDRWKNVQWRVQTERNFIDPDSIIWFGPKSSMLSQSDKLLKAPWTAIRKDLCEVGEQGVSAGAAAANYMSTVGPGDE